jgi:ATP/ADP translocase
MSRLGERTCLLLIPAISGLLLFVLMVETTPTILASAWVILKAVNYAFAWPVRESLYIPTVKSIKFKSKAWIDAFGSKVAKSSGSTFNILMTRFEAMSMAIPIYSAFFASVVFFWFGVAYFLGRRFDQAVADNEVIGLENEVWVEK